MLLIFLKSNLRHIQYFSEIYYFKKIIDSVAQEIRYYCNAVALAIFATILLPLLYKTHLSTS